MDLITAFTNNNLDIKILIKGTIDSLLFRASDILEKR